MGWMEKEGVIQFGCSIKTIMIDQQCSWVISGHCFFYSWIGSSRSNWQIGQLYVEIHGYFAPFFIIRIA